MRLLDSSPLGRTGVTPAPSEAARRACPLWLTIPDHAAAQNDRTALRLLLELWAR